MIDSSIIEKIQKLRAITEQRGATEPEAIAAEQRMFSLLARYNLEISQIPEGEPTRPDTRIESESTARPGSVWEQCLYTGVANSPAWLITAMQTRPALHPSDVKTIAAPAAPAS